MVGTKFKGSLLEFSQIGKVKLLVVAGSSMVVLSLRTGESLLKYRVGKKK